MTVAKNTRAIITHRRPDMAEPSLSDLGLELIGTILT